MVFRTAHSLCSMCVNTMISVIVQQECENSISCQTTSFAACNNTKGLQCVLAHHQQAVKTPNVEQAAAAKAGSCMHGNHERSPSLGVCLRDEYEVANISAS